MHEAIGPEEYGEYPLTKADSDAFERCTRCTQLFAHEELDDGLCSSCVDQVAEDDAGEQRHRELMFGNGCDGREL